ncbi:hypothetical protein HanXRQr2_Chr03g0094501 [Helianthus annuus]|uniref:Uncharacterized protein n=1 Tax=Helianthus annuus TaxID=4232 RepID=A0A9K3JCP3_HELAN|nr:hypothetical protein HanXRQr2_Chr03g0094501 [Helianthus annuus]
MALEDLEPQLPHFTGSDPNSWISQSELYFRFYSIYGDERFSYVIEVFEDEPFYWFNSWFRSDDLTWNDFTTAMLHRFCSSSLKAVDTVVELSPPPSALNVFDEMPATLDKQDSLILQLRDQIPQYPTDCYDVLVPLNPNFSMPYIGESAVDLSSSQFPTDSISQQVYLSTVNNIDLGFTQANRLAVAPLIQFDSLPIITSIDNSDVIHEGYLDILLSQSFVLVYSGPKFVISAVSTNKFQFGSFAMVTDGLLSPFCDKVQLTDFGFDPGPYFFNSLYSDRIIIMPNHIGVDLFEFCASNLDHHCHSASKLFVFNYDSDSPDPYTTLTSDSIQLGTSNVVFQFQTHLPNSATNTFLPCFVVSHSTRIFSSVLSKFQENLTMETSPIIKDIETLDMALQRATTLVASPRYKSPPNKPMEKIIGYIGRSIDLMLFASQDVSMNGNENLGALQSNMMTIVQFRVTDPSHNSDFLSVDMNIIVVAESFSCSSVEEVWYLKGGYVETSTFEKFALHTSEILSDLSCVGTKQARFDIWLFMFISIKCEKMLRMTSVEGSTHDVVFEIGHLILGSTSVVITQTVHYFDQPMGLFWNAHLAAVYIFNQSHTFVQASKGIVKTRLVYWVLKFLVGDKRLSWKGGTAMIIRYYTMWLWIRSRYSFSLATVDFLGDRLHPNSVEWVGYCIPVAQRLLFPSMLPLRHSLTSNPFTFVQSATYTDVRLALGTNTTSFCLVYSTIRAAALLHGEATVFFKSMMPSTSRILSITFWLGTTFWRRGGIWSFNSNALLTSYKQVVVGSIRLYGCKGLMLIYVNKNCQELKEMDMRFTYYLIGLSTYGSKCQIQPIMISHSPRRLAYLAKCIQKVKYNHFQLESYWSWALHTFGLLTFDPKFYVDTTSKIDLSIAKRAFHTLSKTENESILVHVMLSFEALYGHKPPDNLLCLRHCILVAQQLEPATRFLLLNSNITFFPAQIRKTTLTPPKKHAHFHLADKVNLKGGSNVMNRLGPTRLVSPIRSTGFVNLT